MSKHTKGYEITKDGRVFSVESNWRGYGKRELKQHLNYHRYPSVHLTVDGVRRHYAVHVLVAENHLPPKPSEEHEIRHLDGNKLNSSAANLAWGTAKENAADRESHGRTSRGDAHSSTIKRSSHILKVKRGNEHYQTKRKEARK